MRISEIMVKSNFRIFGDPSSTSPMTTTLTQKNNRSSSSVSSSLPSTLNHFTLLPITLPSPLPSVPPATHIIYLRRHEEPPIPPALVAPEPSRTIFAVNVPIDSTKELLRGLFASLGARLEGVTFHSAGEGSREEEGKLPYPWDRRLCPTGETVHITFPEAGDVDKVLRKIGKLRKKRDGSGGSGGIVTWGEGVTKPSSLGFQRNLLPNFLAPCRPFCFSLSHLFLLLNYLYPCPFSATFFRQKSNLCNRLSNPPFPPLPLQTPSPIPRRHLPNPIQRNPNPTHANPQTSAFRARRRRLHHRDEKGKTRRFIKGEKEQGPPTSELCFVNWTHGRLWNWRTFIGFREGRRGI